MPANKGDIRDQGSIPGLGRSPGEGLGNPLQYSCLENPTDRGAWQATVHGVAKSETTEQLNRSRTRKKQRTVPSFLECPCVVCPSSAELRATATRSPAASAVFYRRHQVPRRGHIRSSVREFFPSNWFSNYFNIIGAWRGEEGVSIEMLNEVGGVEMQPSNKCSNPVPRSERTLVRNCDNVA